MDATLLILVSLLGSDDFKTREAADHALVRMDAYLYLSWGEKSGDVERRTRCRRILDAWHDRHADVLAAGTLSRFGATPWLYPYHDTGYLACARKRIGWGNADNDWEDYREATRLYVSVLHRARLPESEITRQLDEFLKEEIRWKRAFKAP